MQPIRPIPHRIACLPFLRVRKLCICATDGGNHADDADDAPDEAAAWLSDPREDVSEEKLLEHRQRDAQVCAKMVKVGWSMIEAVKLYSASQKSPIECRIGISYGQVRLPHAPPMCVRLAAWAGVLGGVGERPLLPCVTRSCVHSASWPRVPLVAPTAPVGSCCRPVAPIASRASSLLSTS